MKGFKSAAASVDYEQAYAGENDTIERLGVDWLEPFFYSSESLVPDNIYASSPDVGTYLCSATPFFAPIWSLSTYLVNERNREMKQLPIACLSH